ncbi:MAG: beta-galactosidase [Limisphaerales bacterium]
MWLGVDYHPEHWVFPYDGTEKEPEARWKHDVALMLKAGVNAVRMGEFCWGLYEPEEGRYQFEWMRRVMDLMHAAEIRVVLGTPTAAPPLWLTQKHPEILPKNEHGGVLSPGTRHAYCLNSDLYWTFSRTIVTRLSEALGSHPSLLAWQIDNGIGGHGTEFSFNEETEHDWHLWLKAKYGTIERMNDLMGLRFWSQTVTDWNQVPMPRVAPTVHNPALMMDWMRFSSDSCIAFVRMQGDLLRQLTPDKPVTNNLRSLTRHFDHFDMAETLDFVSLDSYATVKSEFAEHAMEHDVMRSLKKDAASPPGGGKGFWVIEQKAGNVNWQDVNSVLRPGVVRLFTYQAISRGADGVFYFFWRQPRFGPEKFYGGVLTHDGRGDNRAYKEVTQVGEELRLLAPALEGTRVQAEVCILFSHENEWTQKLPQQPTKLLSSREHIRLFYKALHDRNIAVDFARPSEDLSKYKLVIAPSLHILAAGETDRLKLYVQNGGTLLATFNTGLVDEHSMAPITGFPMYMTDLFGLEVIEFDPMPRDADNHMNAKGNFHINHLHPVRVWADVIEPRECQILATYAKDFYAGRPLLTQNTFGLGRAIYLGTMSQSSFYADLIDWLRGLCGLDPLLKVPAGVEVSLRQKDGTRIYFLLNHQAVPIRLHLLKPMHDFLTGSLVSGAYDLPPHGVLVLDEHSTRNPQSPPPAEVSDA